MTNPSWAARSVYPFPSIPSCKIALALKRSVAAHRFLNKICFNEGYLSSPKVCRSNLETPCIYMLRRHIILLIAIRSSDGDVKPGGPLGAFREEQAMSRTGFHLLPSFHHHHPTFHNTITLHKQLHIQSPYPQLPTVHFTDTRPTRNVVCSSGAWFENRSTQRHLSALRGTQSA